MNIKIILVNVLLCCTYFKERFLVLNEVKFCKYFLIHVMLSTTTSCLNWTELNIPYVTKIMIVM
jgi:hypothetical protein